MEGGITLSDCCGELCGEIMISPILLMGTVSGALGIALALAVAMWAATDYTVWAGAATFVVILAVAVVVGQKSCALTKRLRREGRLTTTMYERRTR
jgi:hypothetical protein|tara:strand:- start:1681 stop:1968 length:288 start_codon:yes stop_codon:yes gene_type:complete